MTLHHWLNEHLPKGRTSLSMDAVEILIKLAWEEAVESERQRAVDAGWQKPPEIIDPYDIP